LFTLSTPSLTVLAKHDQDTLVQSAQGFLLVFRARTPADIARQLRSFDAEEWRPGIAKTFRQELDGLLPERLRDASTLLDECKGGARARLDTDILDVSGVNLEVYNLLHSTTPFRVKARLQALTVLPMLKWEFWQMDDSIDRVRRRIDAGNSVWDAFLEIHPGKTATLRRIAASPSGPEAWRGNLAGLLEVLDPLPPEKIPASEEDWNAFHSIYLGMALDGESDDERRAVKIRWLVESAQIGWQKTYRRLSTFEGGTSALADAFDFLDEVGSVGDALAGRYAQSNLSWEAWKKQSRRRWMLAPEQLGLFRLLEGSVRWHRALWTEAGLPEDSDPRRRSWPPLLPQPVMLGDGITAVALDTAQALASEGHRLHHCVGSYWQSCCRGESHIVSLRDASGHSLSTLELRIPNSDRRQCEIVQHRALSNQTPAPALRALEDRLCAQVAQLADFKALAKWQQSAVQFDGGLSPLEINALANSDEHRFERLATIMGRDRLLGLFGAMPKSSSD
jgi:hypothetical protein